MAPQVSVPVIAVVGWAGTGKTTVVERLIPALRRQGLGRVAAIKHTHHTQLDVPGKDSDRLRQAGATAVAVSGPQGWALFYSSGHETPPESLVALLYPLGPFDLVLLEGFKRGPWPKIEVVRKAVNPELLSSPGELVAVVADIPAGIAGVPWFTFGEEEKLAAAVVAWLRRHHRGKDT
ncbi:MAG: molybdopterin-guanine dinucleotide biosynthesis protein B [Clostridia bacterium]|nr:molybdopterin-guanine dinucleotide biosynthesis protein B [Clostridia bacterium]